MLRDKSLIPLSRQHQHALALCVRIDRASPIAESDLSAWREEIVRHFHSEIRIHFAAEEQVLFPAARDFPELGALVDNLLSDHAWLREKFIAAEAGRLSAADITEFSQRLSAHIRKEERQLFERMQELLDKDELARLGNKLDKALEDADQQCSLPGEATRLRPAK